MPPIGDRAGGKILFPPYLSTFAPCLHGHFILVHEKYCLSIKQASRRWKLHVFNYHHNVDNKLHCRGTLGKPLSRQKPRAQTQFGPYIVAQYIFPLFPIPLVDEMKKRQRPINHLRRLDGRRGQVEKLFFFWVGSGVLFAAAADIVQASFPRGPVASGADATRIAISSPETSLWV